MTNTETPGAHRPENASRLYGRPVDGTPSPHHRGGGTPLAGQINARAWRDRAEGIRADLEAKAILKDLRGRGAGA